MVTIKLSIKNLNIDLELQRLAERLELTVVQHEADTYRIIPEYILGIHGIWCEVGAQNWSFWRESDATTWEDFLLMHITHSLAVEHGALLTYDWGKSEEILVPDGEAFATFDSYAEYVTRHEEGIVKDMKKNWIYSHRKRYFR